MKPPHLYSRLSLLMFLQFLVWGSWMVTLGTYLLKTLDFSGTEVGMIYATTAIAATASPLLLGVLADRFFAAERLLAVLHLLGAACIYTASTLQSFWPVYGCMVLYTLCYMPTFSLSNALCFHHLEHPSVSFPPIRVWGTVSWVLIGFVLSWLQIEDTYWPLRLSAGFSLLQAAYCLTLPHTPPQAERRGFFAELRTPAMQELLRDRSFAVLIVALALICIPSAYYYSFVNPFLTEIGVPRPAATMSLGQVVEIGAVLSLPWFLTRLRLKRVIFLGLFLWGVRYIAFAYANANEAVALVYFGVGVQGFAYAFTALAAQIYVDSRVPVHLKGTAQGFIAFLTLGLGAFVGSYIAGGTVSLFALADGSHDWRSIWWLPGAVGVVVALGFWYWFRPGRGALRRGIGRG